jgi:hypothetical protein
MARVEGIVGLNVRHHTFCCEPPRARPYGESLNCAGARMGRYRADVDRAREAPALPALRNPDAARPRGPRPRGSPRAAEFRLPPLPRGGDARRFLALMSGKETRASTA